MEHVISVVTAQGVPFYVVYDIRKTVSGEDIGATPVVAFYDRRYRNPFRIYGQFVADYHVETLLNRDLTGLDLYGGVADWTIDRANMVTITDWLQLLVENLS